MADIFHIFELHQQGYYCSQILMLLGLEAQEKSNPDLVRAMSGLAGGLGFTGQTCGALTGGACLLGLYAGRGGAEEEEADRFQLMVTELVEWFQEEHGANYGGITCEHILGDALQYKAVSMNCGNIVAGTYDKVQEILTKYGIDPAGGQ